MFNQKGFTLVELLVVVLIIGILAAIAVPQYQKAVLKSRVSELMLLTKYIKDQQEVFFLEKGQYASGCKELNVNISGDYILDEEKDLLVDENKNFQLDCNRGSRYNNDQYRTAGLYQPTSGGLLSIEMYYAESPYPNARSCFAAQNNLLQDICKNICGEELENSSCGW